MWFPLSLFFALATAAGIAISKRVLRNTDVLVYIAFTGLLTLIVMSFVIVLRPIPTIDTVFLLALLTAACINVATSIFSFYAIKIAPVSLLAPLSAFNPVSATFFGFLFLGEHVETIKFVGIVFIVVGAYLLHITDLKEDMLAPLRSLLQNRGVQLTFVANVLWGVTPVLEKTAIVHSNPPDALLSSFAEIGILTAILFPVMLVRTKDPFGQFKRNVWWYIIPAPFGALAAWSAFSALSLANIGYVTAVFKLSLLFTIFFGAIFFKEERIKERLLGGVVMFIGTVLLVV